MEIDKSKINAKIVDEKRNLSKDYFQKVILLIRKEIESNKVKKFNKGQTIEITPKKGDSEIRKELSSSFKNTDEFSAILTYNDEVIGFINFVVSKVDKDTLCLNHYIIDELYRGKGLGRILFNFAVSNIKDMAKFFTAEIINNDTRMRSILAHSGIQDQYLTTYRSSNIYMKVH